MLLPVSPVVQNPERPNGEVVCVIVVMLCVYFVKRIGVATSEPDQRARSELTVSETVTWRKKAA